MVKCVPNRFDLKSTRILLLENRNKPNQEVVHISEQHFLNWVSYQKGDFERATIKRATSKGRRLKGRLFKRALIKRASKQKGDNRKGDNVRSSSKPKVQGKCAHKQSGIALIPINLFMYIY